MGRAVAAVAVVAIVVCLLAVWALCRAAALGDRIGERQQQLGAHRTRMAHPVP